MVHWLPAKVAGGKGHPRRFREVLASFRAGGGGRCPTAPADNQHKPLTLPSCEGAELLRSEAVDEIILTVSSPGHPEIVELTSRCSRLGIAVSMVPQPYELYLTKPALSDLDGLPLLQLLSVSTHEPAWKRGFDVAVLI